jgi:hypothetical protein
MTVTEKRFCIVLLINMAVAIFYVVWSSLGRREGKKTDILMKGIVMFLCPVVGPLFFFAGLVFNKVFFRQNVDLEDVIFSKERVKTHPCFPSVLQALPLHKKVPHMVHTAQDLT